ncbi:Uncharacterised protein [Mycobacteroides abscessus subsp. abscessus]|uniref:hypothetical protein n=1 Tax=Mycobacteroides abscessus TaxID=36809 RepID=UPI00092A82C7|nr:hypothetical protein [Mycobacteroides abscessus]SIB94625.1 Uncharacterised protein [Mycobacteroides abscessus subsp. abscessus]
MTSEQSFDHEVVWGRVELEIRDVAELERTVLCGDELVSWSGGRHRPECPPAYVEPEIFDEDESTGRLHLRVCDQRDGPESSVDLDLRSQVFPLTIRRSADTHRRQQETDKPWAPVQLADEKGDIVMKPPGDVSRYHFGVDDMVQFGYDAGSPTATVIVAEPDSDNCLRLADISGSFGGEEYRTRVSSLLHVSGCTECATFKADWEAKEQAAWDAERAAFTPEALALADHLVCCGLTLTTSSGLACGHGNTYVLSTDAPVQPWFREALEGAVFSGPEGPWPNWGRTCHAVDWPGLIAQQPDALVPDHGMLANNFGATWESIAEAFTLLRTVDPDAHMDVSLWVDEHGRITVDPFGFYATREVDRGLAQRIDALLIAGGRGAENIHDAEYAPSLSGWHVEC